MVKLCFTRYANLTMLLTIKANSRGLPGELMGLFAQPAGETCLVGGAVTNSGLHIETNEFPQVTQPVI